MREEVPFGHCAEMLAALAAPERLRIIRLLSTGPRCVGAIADALGVPLENLSHHLTVLLAAGLLHKRKKGRFVLCSLAPGRLQSDDQEGIEYLDLGCCRLEMTRSEKES